MADVTKLNRIGPKGNRYQYFYHTDMVDGGIHPVVQGDVLRITDSLGRAGGTIYIETEMGCDLEITLNSRIMVYPKSDSIATHRVMLGGYEKALPALANGVEARTANPAVPIGSGATVELPGPVDDIEITTWTMGGWTIKAE